MANPNRSKSPSRSKGPGSRRRGISASKLSIGDIVALPGISGFFKIVRPDARGGFIGQRLDATRKEFFLANSSQVSLVQDKSPAVSQTAPATRRRTPNQSSRPDRGGAPTGSDPLAQAAGDAQPRPRKPKRSRLLSAIDKLAGRGS